MHCRLSIRERQWQVGADTAARQANLRRARLQRQQLAGTMGATTTVRSAERQRSSMRRVLMPTAMLHDDTHVARLSLINWDAVAT